MRICSGCLTLFAVSCFAADVNAPEADGTTPLHWAVRADDLAKVNSFWPRAPTPRPRIATASRRCIWRARTRIPR